MTEIDWADVRTRAVIAFHGELPYAPTEHEIIIAFERNPRLVLGLIDQVTEQVAEGKARNGWALLRHRLLHATTPSRETKATLDGDRESAIRLAERWIRKTGIHLDRESELEDDLFGERGMLRAWASDAYLRQRMLKHWSESRTKGELLEREVNERAKQWLAVQARLHSQETKTEPEPEPEPQRRTYA